MRKAPEMEFQIYPPGNFKLNLKSQKFKISHFFFLNISIEAEAIDRQIQDGDKRCASWKPTADTGTARP